MLDQMTSKGDLPLNGNPLGECQLNRGLIMLSWIVRKAQKTKLAYEDAERSTFAMISRGERQYPSWINDPFWRKSLADSVLEEAMKNGLTKDQAVGWLSKKEVGDKIMTMTAQLEKANFSKLGQISSAMEFAGKLAAAQAREWRR